MADQLLRFWSKHGAFDETEAYRYLKGVACVLRDETGELAAANSVHAARVALIGNREFWVYRSFLAPGFDYAAPAMLAAAFAALEAEFDPTGDEPIGLYLAIADAAELNSHPEAEWLGPPRMIYAGALDGRRIWIGYFAGAKIGEGSRTAQPPAAPVLRDRDDGGWMLEDGHRVELFAEQQAIDEQAVIDLWLREGVLSSVEARRRARQVLLVATDSRGELAGVSTAYIRYSTQLRMELWYYRGFVARAHRISQLAFSFSMIGRDHLSHQFVDRRERRAGGIIYEIENEGLKRAFNEACWQPMDFTFIGENERGDHVRVHYFPGSIAPRAGS